MDRLNKLGICDSPKTCTRLLTAVAKCSDENVIQWKTLFETNQKALHLLQEVKDKQLQVNWDENDMHVVQNVEFSEKIIKLYMHYDKDAYEQC